MAAAVLTGLQACKKASGDYPGDSYTWDMMYSKAYEPYALNPLMPDICRCNASGKWYHSLSWKCYFRPDGSCSGIYKPSYEYAKTDEDYERAGL